MNFNIFSNSQYFSIDFKFKFKEENKEENKFKVGVRENKGLDHEGITIFYFEKLL